MFGRIAFLVHAAIGGVATISIPCLVMAAGEAMESLPAGAPVAATGDWATHAPADQVSAATNATHRWQLELTKAADGTLSGSATVQGSPLMQTGRVTGRVAGQGVTGTISDEKGRMVATFSGTLDERTGAMRGRYEDRTGEVGDWAWSGGTEDR